MKKGALGRPEGRRRRNLRRAVAIISAAGALTAGLLIFLYLRSRPDPYRPGEDHPEITRTLQKEIPEEAPQPRFVEVAHEAGLGNFEPFRGPRSSQLPEDMGPGAAWGDYDNDGDEDLFLVSAGGSLKLPVEERSQSVLYENLGDGRFRAVKNFPDTRIIGMGAAWGDYDGDGWLDLVVSGYQSLILYRNERGTFRRDGAFPEPPGYWAGVSWGDFDNDRDLDLYVCGYVQYTEADSESARASQQYGRTVPYTLNPASFKPHRNLLFRNDGDGRFTEVAEDLGIDNPQGRSLGALWHDFDDDGWLDLYVANDISDNALYLNRGGKFEDVSHAAWVADYRGAMGLAAADWNRDGDDDLFVSHWVAQENALYDSLWVDLRGRSEGASDSGETAVDKGLRFMDNADARGLGYIALQFVGWGAEFADFDADGWVDLAVANGSTFETDDRPPRLRSQEPFLFWNRRGEHFDNLAVLNESLSTPRVARGLALADYDNDGDVDLLIICRESGPLLYRNDMQSGNWIKIRLRSLPKKGKEARGFGDGTKLIARTGGAEQRHTVSSASYLSQSSRVVHFGLGPSELVEELEVRWHGGETVTYSDLAAGTVWELFEGDPRPRRAGARETDDRTRIVQFWKHQRAAVRAMKMEGNLTRAIEQFRAALEIDPAHEDSRYYLGNCLAALGEIDSALAEFTELARINPRGSRSYRRWGTLRALHASSEDDLRSSHEALARALATNPEETGSLQALAEVELLMGRMDEADEHLTWIGRTNPRAAGSFFLRGYIAWRNGDPAVASGFLERVHEALGPEWKPEGTTAEGDVQKQLHAERTPLSRFWEAWDGSIDPASAFTEIHSHLSRAEGVPVL